MAMETFQRQAAELCTQAWKVTVNAWGLVQGSCYLDVPSMVVRHVGIGKNGDGAKHAIPNNLCKHD